MYLGVTTVIRNGSNSFADPVLLLFFIVFAFGSMAMKWLLAFFADKAKVWAPSKEPRIMVDVSLVNRLDVENNRRRIINNI